MSGSIAINQFGWISLRVGRRRSNTGRHLSRKARCFSRSRWTTSGSAGDGGTMRVRRGCDNWVIAITVIRVIPLCRFGEIRVRYIIEAEFQFLRLLKDNTKPLIILLNVDKNFRDSRRGSYELKRFLKNPDKLFAMDGSSQGSRKQCGY